MKIYLDIDDTLINTDMYNMRPANYLKKFLEQMLKDHDVYWLTTHCDGDATTAVFYMSKFVSPEVTDLIMKIKPTKWKILKTEAIDMNEDFLWFDDAPTWGDIDVLKKHNKLEFFVRVNLDEDPNILRDFLDQPISCRGYVVDILKKSYMLHIWTRPRFSIGWHRKMDGPNKKVFGIQRYGVYK